jgi:hypothetical protein
VYTVVEIGGTTMFADELRRAIRDGDGAAICRLIEAIPAADWSYLGSPVYAQARKDSVEIAVHHVSGGSGINTYDSVSVYIRWPDGTKGFGGEYSAEELRLPNYIPPSQRRPSEGAEAAARPTGEGR